MAGPKAGTPDELLSKEKEARQHDGPRRGKHFAKRSLGHDNKESARQDHDTGERHSKKAKTDGKQTSGGATAIAGDTDSAPASGVARRLQPHSSPSHRASDAAHVLQPHKTSSHNISSVTTRTSDHIENATPLPANTTTKTNRDNQDLDHDAHSRSAQDATEAGQSRIQHAAKSGGPKALKAARFAAVLEHPQHKLHSDPKINEMMIRSDAFMTSDKRMPQRSQEVQQYLRDQNYNDTHGISEKVPFPAPPTSSVQLDRTTPYHAPSYNASSITSLEAALKTVNKDMKMFKSKPHLFDPFSKPGQKDSLCMDQATGIKYDLKQAIGAIRAKEQIEYEWEKEARKDAEFDALEEREAYLDKTATRRWVNRTAKSPSPPPRKLEDDKESFELIRARRDVGVYSIRDYPDRKEEEEENAAKHSHDADEKRKQEEVAKSYNMQRPKWKPRQKACRVCGGEGHIVKDCPRYVLIFLPSSPRIKLI